MLTYRMVENNKRKTLRKSSYCSEKTYRMVENNKRKTLRKSSYCSEKNELHSISQWSEYIKSNGN